MAGRYEYGSEPHDVYRRHDNCGCTVIYESGRQRQDVWTKKTWEVPESAKKKYEPVRLSPERAKTLQQAKLSQYRGLTNSSKNGRINYAKPLDMFNYSDIPDTEIITPKSIVAELEKSNIGKQILQVIETLPEPIRFTYDEFCLGIRGKEERGQITIYLNNCKDVIWAARSVIHECTHYRYGIGQSQWAESVCVAQELKHARGRDKLTYEELKTIIRAVKMAYPEYNWRKGGIINGRRKTR